MRFPQSNPFRLLFLLVLCLAAIGSVMRFTMPVAAQTTLGGVARLEGHWQATLIWSGSGCGPMSGLVSFSLDRTGSTNGAVLITHGACGDNVLYGQSFTIGSLNPNGSGTAGLSCGPGCGWNFNIQVSRDGQVFNLVDVAPENPGNYVAGTAIRQGMGMPGMP